MFNTMNTLETNAVQAKRLHQLLRVNILYIPCRQKKKKIYSVQFIAQILQREIE